MHSSRSINVVPTMDFPLQMQGVHSLLATHLPNPKTVRGKTVTLVMGVDGLANNAFVNYMTGSRAPAQAATYARVMNLPSQENAVLCECPALGAEGLSDAANIATSFSTEITIARAKKIRGVVVVIPFEHLSTIEGYKQFSHLMTELSYIIGDKKIEDKKESITENAIQVVVLGNDAQLTSQQAKKAYDESLKRFIAEGQEIQLALTVVRRNDDYTQINSRRLDFLKLLKSFSHSVLFANRAVVASECNRMHANDVFGASCEAMAQQIGSLSFCNPSFFHLEQSYGARSVFDKALVQAMASYSKFNESLIKTMASFLSLPHIASFAGKESFLSKWQFRNSALSLNAQALYSRSAFEPLTQSIGGEATAKCRV